MGNIKRWHVGQKVYLKRRLSLVGAPLPRLPVVIVELNETQPAFMSQAIVLHMDGTTQGVWLSDLSHNREPRS